MIAECNDVSCIQTDNLLKREGKYNVIIITSDTPIWPLNILSGCISRCDVTQYREGGQRFQTAEVKKIYQILFSHCASCCRSVRSSHWLLFRLWTNTSLGQALRVSKHTTSPSQARQTCQIC